MILYVRLIHPDAVEPVYAYPDDAGGDLVVVEGGVLEPGEARDFPIGIEIEPPTGYWGLIHGRSSTLRKRGLFVNPGIIDHGYRGPLFVYARNDNDYSVTISKGDRLAQLLFLPYMQPQIRVVKELGESGRGSSGFGSTGANTNGGRWPG